MAATCSRESLRKDIKGSNNIAASIIAKVYETLTVYRTPEGGETTDPELADYNRFGETEKIGSKTTYLIKKKKKPVNWDRSNPIVYNAAIDELEKFNTFQNSPICQDKFETVKMIEHQLNSNLKQ